MRADNAKQEINLTWPNPDIIFITETLPKHIHLPVNDCKLQVHHYDCFSNTTDSNCHRGVVIYVKKYLNATCFCINQSRLKEYSCCKIVLKHNTILYIICVYRSPNSTIENNDLLNQTIEDVSNLKGELLLLGDFNYPNNWEKLYVSHTPEHCASKFFTATQNSFLHQHVSAETHSRPNQRSTLIDLKFTSDDQSITNLIYASPLGKSHHKILKFNYLHAIIKVISNASVKLAKKQGNAMQHPEAELLLFENYSHSSSMLSSKNNSTYSKK